MARQLLCCDVNICLADRSLCQQHLCGPLTLTHFLHAHIQIHYRLNYYFFSLLTTTTVHCWPSGWLNQQRGAVVALISGAPPSPSPPPQPQLVVHQSTKQSWVKDHLVDVHHSRQFTQWFPLSQPLLLLLLARQWLQPLFTRVLIDSVLTFYDQVDIH